MTDLDMPPAIKPATLTNEELVDAFVFAADQEEGAFTTKQMKAWAKRAAECRAELLKRMAR